MKTNLLMITWRLCRAKELSFHHQDPGLFLYHSRHPNQGLPRKILHLSSLACHVWQLHLRKYFSSRTSLLLPCIPGIGQENWSFSIPITRNNCHPTLLRVYSPSSAAGKRLFLTWSSCPKEVEDGDSWSSTMGKEQTETPTQTQHSSPLSPLISLSQKKLRYFCFAMTPATAPAALWPSTSSFMPLVTCTEIQWGLWGLKKNFSLFSKDTVHHNSDLEIKTRLQAEPSRIRVILLIHVSRHQD